MAVLNPKLSRVSPPPILLLRGFNLLALGMSTFAMFSKCSFLEAVKIFLFLGSRTLRGLDSSSFATVLVLIFLLCSVCSLDSFLGFVSDDVCSVSMPWTKLETFDVFPVAKFSLSLLGVDVIISNPVKRYIEDSGVVSFSI